MSNYLYIERNGSIATIVINRPEKKELLLSGDVPPP